MQKGQKEKNYASARRRKAKKRKITLLHDAERSKREKTHFCAVQKGQKEKKHASARCRKFKKRKKHVSERLRKVKKENYEEESGFLYTKREGRYVAKWLFERKERREIC